MLKQYKKSLIASSLLTLLPIAVGLLLWDKFPAKMTTHWGMAGQPDGYSSVPFAVFVLPLILLAVQWLCVWITAKDPGNKNRNKKPLGLVLWIIPVLSNLESGMMYALALGADFSVTGVMVAAMGLMFVAIGNYLPKCKMNATIGIKVPWTYTSEENWNATHRFGGRVWAIGGLAMMLCGFLPAGLGVTIMIAAVFILALVPIFYSYLYYRRQKANGDALIPLPKTSVKHPKLVALLLCLLVLFVLLVLFSGKVEVSFGEDAFTIEASYWGDLTVDYASIEGIEYREGNVDGVRVTGVGTFRLLLGYFQNEEFGTYTRYTYYKPDACVVLTVGDRTLVLSGKTAADTQEIYEELLARTN